MWRADFRQNNQIQQILPDHFVQYDENKISRKYLHFSIDKSIYLCYNIYGNKGESESSSTQRADRPPKKFSKKHLTNGTTYAIIVVPREKERNTLWQK